MASKIITRFSMLAAVPILAACFLNNEKNAGTRVGTETTVRASVQFPDSTHSLFARIAARNWDYRPDFILRNPDNFEINKTTDEKSAFSMTLAYKDSLLLEISTNDNAYGAWIAVAQDGIVPDTIALALTKTLRIIPTFSNSVTRMYIGFLGTNRYFPITSQVQYDFISVPTLRFPMEIMVQTGADTPLVTGKILLDTAGFKAADTLSIGFNLDGVIQKILDNPGHCTFKLDSAGAFVPDGAQTPLCFPGK